MSPTARQLALVGILDHMWLMPSSMPRAVWFGALVAAVTCCDTARAADTVFEPPLKASGTVTHVHDGDTVDLRTATGVERVRIKGIDAPELGQPYSKVSRNAQSAPMDVLPMLRSAELLWLRDEELRLTGCEQEDGAEYVQTWAVKVLGC